MGGNDNGEKTREELARALQYHTGHNHSPPPPNDPLGQVRLSPDIHNILCSIETPYSSLIRRPAIRPSPVDDNWPLQDYYISSSHNTYLLANQLTGKSSAASYTHILNLNGRCVEIDVWPSPNGPVVTHGYTLTSTVLFSDVCRSIGDFVAPESWPVLVSLECHVDEKGQKELVKQMVDAWGDKLVRGPVEGVYGDITPANLKGRIILMVEYYSPSSQKSESSDEESYDDSDDESGKEEKTKRRIFSRIFKKEHRVQGRISDELAEYGYYARSMKPKKGWLTENNVTNPLNILINISESSCKKLLPSLLTELISDSQRYLRRIYPKGTRIKSSNLDPLLFWRNGSHIASLNWQVFDQGMQLNEALFVGSPGWVLKPKHLRKGTGRKDSGKERLVVDIIGASSLPAPNGRQGKTFSAYIKAQLLHESRDMEWRSQSVKTLHDANSGADVLWKEQIEWYYECDEMAFFRLSICEDELGKDDQIVLFCAKLDHIVKDQWLLVRMFNRQCRNSGATVLARFATYQMH